MSFKINLEKLKPKNTYSRYGSECYVDPFRQMLAPCTPESLLLFKMEMYVHKVMGVPRNMMFMNQSMRKYGVNSAVTIDIMIHDMIDGESRPVAILECRSPEAPLYNVSRSHMEEFAKTQGINCIIFTNGSEVESYISRGDRLSFWEIDKIPDYATICASHRESLILKAEKELANATANAAPGETAEEAVAEKAASPAPKLAKPLKFDSKSTPREIQPVVMGLVKTLGDSKVKMKAQEISGISVVGDWGMRKKLVGFGVKNNENKLQRTILIKDFYGNHQLVSFDVSPGVKRVPVLSVTLDDYDNRQVVLALDLNDCLKLEGGKVTFSCDLAKTFPNDSEEFIENLKRAIADKCPDLLSGSVATFGEIESAESSRMDVDDMAGMLMSMAALALITDECREEVKAATKRAKKVVKVIKQK